MEKNLRAPFVIPEVKKHEAKSNAEFELNENTVAHFGENGKEAIMLLEHHIKIITGFHLRRSRDGGSPPKNTIAAEICPKVKGSAGKYILEVHPNSILLRANSSEGLFYAAQTLTDLLEYTNGRWIIRGCKIQDWPDFSWRGLMIDPAREFIPVETIKRYMEAMARSKLNILHIHFSDAESFTLRSENYPELNRSPGNGKMLPNYTRKDISEIISCAEKNKIQVIPEIDIPGHATHLLKALPELKCRIAGGEASTWTLCAGGEETYEFLDTLFGEFAPLFPSDYFHIGADELESRNEPELADTSWRKCSKCRARMHEENLSGFRQLFYYFIRRNRDLLGKYGKKTMMWNENIDISSPISPEELPRDILIHFWRIAYKGRGPRSGCSLSKFLRQDFKVINSYYPETYIHRYAKEEKLLTWNPAKRPPVPERYKNSVLGGEICGWGKPGRRKFYERLLPPSLALYGDRTWNSRNLRDTKLFYAALPGHIFGPNAVEKFDDLFEVLGGIIPPQNTEKRAHIEKSLRQLSPEKRKERYLEIEKSMKEALSKGGILNQAYLEEAIESIKWLSRENKSG